MSTNELAQQCESWWACLGGAASGVSAPCGGLSLNRRHLPPKVGVRDSGLESSVRRHAAVKEASSEGSVESYLVRDRGYIEANIYTFRMLEQYATMVISGMDAPAIFGPSNSVAVLTQCPKDHTFALATEAFLFTCKDMARLMTLGEIESLEKRIGSDEELLKDHRKARRD